MTDSTGKIDRALFESAVFPYLGADREDVAVGPQHGVDFGVLAVDGRAVVLATDPVSVLPELGFERAGRFALDIVLADVAVSGIAPTHLTVSLSLPPALADEDLATLWRAMHDRAAELGVSVVSGHTARYDGVEFPWVGAATALGVGEMDAVVRPDGARPGDAVVVTTGPGAETAGLFASLFGERLGLPAGTVATTSERLDDTGAVRDAAAAASAGRVTAMHDATEGGIQGGFVEMADGAGVRFDVERTAVPEAPGVAAVCGALDVDPWQVTSAGTLLVTVASADAGDVVAALRERGTRATVVGRVSEGEGVFVDGERVEHPGSDPSWAVFQELSGGTQ